MKYITVAEAAEKWGLTPRSVQIHCEKGNIPGVNMLGKTWRIPADAERPRRKPRSKALPASILEILKSEKRGHISGGGSITGSRSTLPTTRTTWKEAV